ncbi:LacI family DNA-binding transcriptional regulator, partial [Microbacterium lacticum]
MTSRRATIADVAREAAVSPSTASVVFSGKTPVSDATRRRVTEAAARLGYTGPDPRAASL